jgi:hypothetical protein
MVDKATLFRKPVLLTVMAIVIVSIILGMVLTQSWFESEIQKQLTDTETEINSIEIYSISLWTRSVSIEVNTSVENPHDIVVTVNPANLSVEYINAQLGVIHLPRIEIEEYSKTVLFNATFQVPTIHWTAYYEFFTDLIDDSEVTVNVTGSLTVQAPSLFGVVTAEVEMHTEVVLVTDLIFETIKA